jgi:hypothetical protein
MFNASTARLACLMRLLMCHSSMAVATLINREEDAVAAVAAHIALGRVEKAEREVPVAVTVVAVVAAVAVVVAGLEQSA